MESWYVPVYVQPWPTQQGIQVTVGVVLRFDQAVQSYFANLQCAAPDGTRTPYTFDFVIVERFGSWAICQMTTQDGWRAAWRAAHNGKGALADESMTSTTHAGLTTRMKNIRTGIKNFLDARGLPVADTEGQRAAAMIKAADLSGFHPAFEVVRGSYARALTEPPTLEAPLNAHHWAMSPQFIDLDQDATGRFPFRSALLAQMKAELDAVPPNSPVRLIHIAVEYGMISQLLDKQL